VNITKVNLQSDVKYGCWVKLKIEVQKKIQFEFRGVVCYTIEPL